MIPSQKTTAATTESTFKIMTWNICTMIFTKRTLSNPQRTSKQILNIAQKEEWKSFKGLIVLNIQECWSWKTGIFPPFLLRLISFFEYIPLIGVLISWVFQFISLLFGILPILNCLPIKYDPKSQIASNLCEFLPHSYSKFQIRWKHALDNGLLMLSNHKADWYGYHKWKNHACDDSLANKGFIYSYYKKFHCLVINVHLQSAGGVGIREEQIEEIVWVLKALVKSIKQEFKNDSKIKIIAAGDWNINMRDFQNKNVEIELKYNHKSDDKKDDEKIEKELQKNVNNKSTGCNCCKRQQYRDFIDIPSNFGEGWQKVNGNTPIDSAFWMDIDHIFVDFPIEKLREQFHGKETNLSDHLMVYNEFKG